MPLDERIDFGKSPTGGSQVSANGNGLMLRGKVHIALNQRTGGKARNRAHEFVRTTLLSGLNRINPLFANCEPSRLQAPSRLSKARHENCTDRKWKRAVWAIKAGGLANLGDSTA